MFGWLKRIFKKKEGQQPAGPKVEVMLPASIPTPEVKEREIEEHTTQQKMEKMVSQEKSFGREPNRPEKTCQKCGAPNDQFMDVCWLCKERV